MCEEDQEVEIVYDVCPEPRGIINRFEHITSLILQVLVVGSLSRWIPAWPSIL